MSSTDHRSNHAPQAPYRTCFHCGEPVPSGTDLSVDIDGASRPMCCAGCRAVAMLIHSSGLTRYYDFRDALPATPSQRDADATRYRAWDRERVLDFHAERDPDGRRALVLVLENVHCAACAWLIRRYLARFDGVVECRLDVADGRLRLRFDPDRTPLSRLAAALERLGYPPHLDAPDSGLDRDRLERRRMLRYLVVAALGMMQVMSYALANYIGAFQGIDPETEQFFKLVSMIVAVPVALYAGQPFYRSAVQHLRQRHLGLDVPVAAAILLALFSSVVITLFGSGEVYFDSVVMFVFFLLLGRFAVLLARQRSGAVHSALSRALPTQARRITDAGTEHVGLIELRVGDRVLVGDGEIVPADGEVIAGGAAVDESLLTGESATRPRPVGDAVLAGSLVTGGALEVRVQRIGRSTVLSEIVELLSEARRRRPRLARFADRAAGAFIGLILVSTAIAAGYWWQADADRVIPVVLAMLVVACPCALALGTPTALASATRGLAVRGLLTADPDALERLPRVTHVVLDKTGTLTRSGMTVADIRSADPDPGPWLSLAAALQRVSAHPIASAFASSDDGTDVVDATASAGAGVSGIVEGRQWWMGRPDWVAERCGRIVDVPDRGLWVALAAADGGPAVLFRVEAALRPGAGDMVRVLHDRGIRVVMASGDRHANVAAMAEQLGIDEFHARMRPDDKLALVDRLRTGGAVVAMVGDGINDAPVLAGADVSVALAEGSAIARTQADFVATGGGLAPVGALFEHGPKVSRVIAQNLSWALVYNLSALPLAAMGWVPPWAAAIGMSASSLAVVLNARRLGRTAAGDRGRRSPAPRPVADIAEAA